MPPPTHTGWDESPVSAKPLPARRLVGGCDDERQRKPYALTIAHSYLQAGRHSVIDWLLFQCTARRQR